MRPIVAKDLRQALNVLDPERALQSEAELNAYYIPRPMSPLEDMQLLLETDRSAQKFLFTGHRGSGKSTELAKLRTQLSEDDFFLVHFSVKQYLNLFDLSYVDVLLSIALQLIEQATQHARYVPAEVQAGILDFTKEISYEAERSSQVRKEGSLELNAYVARLAGKLSKEDATRHKVREVVQYRISDLLDNMGKVATAIQQTQQKRILMIVEDLDKTDLHTAKTLFYEHAQSLQAPRISIIYTFPAPLRHDNDFMQVSMNFSNVYKLPNFKPFAEDGTPDAEGQEALKQLVTRRLNADLFTSGALTALVAHSSGIPRELVALARVAVLEAIKGNAGRVTTDHVARAALKKRRDYEVLLSQEQVALLHTVARTKRIDNTEAYRDLLHNLSVLEHWNGGVWYDVHPLVRALLNDTDAPDDATA